MVKEDRSTWKAKYTMRLTQYLDEYPKVFIVGADNVGSRQMQKIRNDVHLIKIGDKVGASEATLLNMLNISPFSYGLIIRQVYDSGSCFDPSILDIKPADLRMKFSQGVQRLAAFSLGINYPNQASAPHLIMNGFKRLLALAAETDVDFEQAKTLKEYLKDPSKFAAAAAPEPATAAPAAKTAAPAAKAPAKPEPESDDDDMGGLDIFG
ncbi:unnamed protein product [Rotaria magnacalcarata]|uniref:Large ribosomal subunit protein uL10 n=1 Tax=Rotaria magnacalcarata TaxID=392030 RepID=A0A8S2M5C2_9BILA|nr:unnamed protein product [Rotaria magnacalcarata]